MSAKKNVILGVMGALTAGVIVGIMIAPGKGKDTRKKIRKVAADWADSLGSLWLLGKKAAEEAEDEMDAANSSTEKIANKIKAAAS